MIIISCLSQFVRRMRIWIYSKNQYLGFKPFSVWETLKYASLNRCAIRVLYELFMFALNVVLSCSVVFYSLVDQQDVRNKGQTFFGLFTAVLCLTFSQGWVWSKLYLLWQQERFLKKLKKIYGQHRQRNSGRHHRALETLINLNMLTPETAKLPLSLHGHFLILIDLPMSNCIDVPLPKILSSTSNLQQLFFPVD